MRSAVLAFATVAVLGVLGAGPAHAAPSSVQRDGGPCYAHEIGTDSADGTMYCSGLNGIWEPKAIHRAPKVRLGAPCPQLGARAIVFKTDGRATCRQTSDGLRWQW